jgi:hypothetical protein
MMKYIVIGVGVDGEYAVLETATNTIITRASTYFRASVFKELLLKNWNKFVIRERMIDTND